MDVFPDKSLAILSLSSWHRLRCQADIGPHSNQIRLCGEAICAEGHKKRKDAVMEGYGTAGSDPLNVLQVFA